MRRGQTGLQSVAPAPLYEGKSQVGSHKVPSEAPQPWERGRAAGPSAGGRRQAPSATPQSLPSTPGNVPKETGAPSNTLVLNTLNRLRALPPAHFPDGSENGKCSHPSLHAHTRPVQGSCFRQAWETSPETSPLRPPLFSTRGRREQQAKGLQPPCMWTLHFITH